MIKSHEQYIVALDQGTTRSRAILFNHDAKIMGTAQREISQIYPHPGWVEHDPMEIWATQSAVLIEILAKYSVEPQQISAIGITNQRETTIVWDKKTGKPIHNAIVWQCRRTTEICKVLQSSEVEHSIRSKTGLMLDPYFSASKLKWLLDNVEGARTKAQQGELLFGTVDTWLLWNMTQGKVHATDYTNASRTMLFNIYTLEWDQYLLDLFDIPRNMLPSVHPSSTLFGQVNLGGKGGIRIPITGIAGDQQSALYGHLCTQPGMAKNTYGTGCFLLMNTGNKAVLSTHGLLTTLACSPYGDINYALEGSVFMGGAAIQWLRDELNLLHDVADSEYFATKTTDSQGIYIVPAFTGLGAPYWDPHARGAIFGLTRGTNSAHLIRATLEAIAYQTCDVLNAMQADAQITLKTLRVDGGAVTNDFLMQFQADMLSTYVERPVIKEVTALGVAYLAGLNSGFWQSIDELKTTSAIEHIFKPKMSQKKRQYHYEGWQKAVELTRHWGQAKPPK